MDLETAILDLAERHGAYRPAAYHFTLQAVHFTVDRARREGAGPRHVRGPEVLDGIRELARARFGPMAKTVFEQWGVHKTEDFGNIVFQLVEHGILGKTDEDRPSDFARGYDFEQAFVREFDWLDAFKSSREETT
ncbi:MAG TPA: Minf_1886 family protein [Candidatus Eisenbacteria bacterium]|nr:Minf_1886 family protein [Candidatus Eisenbacteria bacterium]